MRDGEQGAISIEGARSSIAGKSYSNQIARIAGKKLVLPFAHMNDVRNSGATDTFAINCRKEQVDHHADFYDFSAATPDDRIEFGLAKSDPVADRLEVGFPEPCLFNHVTGSRIYFARCGPGSQGRLRSLQGSQEQ